MTPLVESTSLRDPQQDLLSRQGLPRTLVLSNDIPQTVNAGSILLYRLLKGYPREKLLVLGPKPHAAAELMACRYEQLFLPLERLNLTRFAPIKRSLDSLRLLPCTPLWTIRRLIGTFRPEIILSIMGGAPSEIAARLARSSRCPLVLIVHDKQELFDPVYPWARRAQIRFHARIYRTAARRLCVSPEMEQHLRHLYGEPGEVLYPNRSEDLKARGPEESLKLIKPPFLRVGYAGTLAYGYGTQLIRLAHSLKGSKIRLRIYGQVASAHAVLVSVLHEVVECCGLVTPPEKLWEKVKAECDAVLLPYAWQDPSSELYRTHFPSKLPEYLALGMPVIVMGPDYATGVKWALRNVDAVLALTDDEPMRWLAAMEDLRTSPKLRVALACGALVAVRRDFDPISILERFQSILRHVGQNVHATSRS